MVDVAFCAEQLGEEHSAAALALETLLLLLVLPLLLMYQATEDEHSPICAAA